MNFKHKLGYMFIGCLFTIAGYILASLGGDTTHAQKNEQVLDKIVCKRLEVVNEEGTTVAAIFTTEYGGTIKAYNKTGRLGTGIYINEEGGAIGFINNEGKLVVGIGTDENGGNMEVFNSVGKKLVGIDATEHGGRMSFISNQSKLAASVGVDEHGGGMKVFNTAGKRVVDIGATAAGSGEIQTYKDGWRNH